MALHQLHGHPVAESVPQTVLPGEKLQNAVSHRAGPGTHVKGGMVVASIVGLPRVLPPDPADLDLRPVCTVARAYGTEILMPEIGSVVTCRVNKVTPRGASVTILSTGPKLLVEKFGGLIRQQDVRATEVDKVDVYKCFRAGDTVRAVVLTLGEPRQYFLTTAANQLGVIYAVSQAGYPCVPVDWETMACTQTGTKEPRKVARI